MDVHFFLKSVIEQQFVFKASEIWSIGQQISNLIIEAHAITLNLICVACEVKFLNLVMVEKKENKNNIP